MTAEETKSLVPGDKIFWAEGKKFFKGKFKGFSHDVLDMKTLIVEDDNAVEDEILHVMLITEESYLRETNRHLKTSFVKNSIPKNEEINDEENKIEENQNDSLIEDSDSEKIEKNKIEKPKAQTIKIVNNSSNSSTSVVDSPRGNDGEMKPNLKTLQILLQKEGYNIERDNNKWVKYHLFCPDGSQVEFIYKLKVWNLYNIYIEKGVQGLLDLV
jgi:hypothetical protein